MNTLNIDKVTTPMPMLSDVGHCLWCYQWYWFMHIVNNLVKLFFYVCYS